MTPTGEEDSTASFDVHVLDNHLQGALDEFLACGDVSEVPIPADQIPNDAYVRWGQGRGISGQFAVG